MTITEQIREELGAAVVAFQPGFVQICSGNIKAALLLSQLFYWSTRTINPDGWIYRKADDLQRETGLTRRHQERARELLTGLGLIEDRVRGNPPTVHFLLKEEAILAALKSQCHQNGKITNRQIPQNSENEFPQHGKDENPFSQTGELDAQNGEIDFPKTSHSYKEEETIKRLETIEETGFAPSAQPPSSVLSAATETLFVLKGGGTAVQLSSDEALTLWRVFIGLDCWDGSYFLEILSEVAQRLEAWSECESREDVLRKIETHLIANEQVPF